MGLPASSCFSLIGILDTQSLPRCLLHVPRRNVGNEGMESGGVERGPLHLMLCGPKNSQPPPFFSNPSAFLFSQPASFLGSTSSPSSSSLFLCKHPLGGPLIALLQWNPRQLGPRKRAGLAEGLTLGAICFDPAVSSRLLRQN